MNGRMAKKLRKSARKEARELTSLIWKTVIGAGLKARILLCWRILWKVKGRSS